MRSAKVVTAYIFNKLLAAGLFVALDCTSTCIDPSTIGRKCHKLGNNAIFIRNESLLVVLVAATSAVLLLLRSICPAGYRI